MTIHGDNIIHLHYFSQCTAVEVSHAISLTMFLIFVGLQGFLRTGKYVTFLASSGELNCLGRTTYIYVVSNFKRKTKKRTIIKYGETGWGD
jgi:hypothetical protein